MSDTTNNAQERRVHRESNRYYRLGDRVMIASDWAREFGVSPGKFYSRWPSLVGLAPCDRHGVTDAEALEPTESDEQAARGAA
jgi:hypothetical protein